jgi:hypothetical protein
MTMIVLLMMLLLFPDDAVVSYWLSNAAVHSDDDCNDGSHYSFWLDNDCAQPVVVVRTMSQKGPTQSRIDTTTMRLLRSLPSCSSSWSLLFHSQFFVKLLEYYRMDDENKMGRGKSQSFILISFSKAHCWMTSFSKETEKHHK